MSLDVWGLDVWSLDVWSLDVWSLDVWSFFNNANICRCIYVTFVFGEITHPHRHSQVMQVNSKATTKVINYFVL